MIKAFFICLLLNILSMFVIDGLGTSAFELNKQALGMTYVILGVIMMLGANIKFVQVLTRGAKRKE